MKNMNYTFPLYFILQMDICCRNLVLFTSRWFFFSFTK